MHFKLFLLNIGRVLHFYYGQQMIRAYVDAVTACSSKEWCKYIYGLIRVYARTVEVQVWHSLKVREMQDPQEYAQTQVSEERRQRVSQAENRYNCYTEKNIVIVLR